MLDWDVGAGLTVKAVTVNAQQAPVPPASAEQELSSFFPYFRHG